MLWTYIPMTTAEINVPVYVPWNNVRLAYATAMYMPGPAAVVGTALDGGDWEIDLELDGAGGTELMSVTFATSTAVGTVSEFDFSDIGACGGLSDKSIIMIESDGHADSTVGGAHITLYFEQDT
jgi:hypothetical protein